MPNDEQMREMDNAAGDAKKELIEHLDEWKATDVGKWMAAWYMKAGYKRLGRILVELAKKSE